MNQFTEFMTEKLRRLGIACKCAACGNTNPDELAMSMRGQLHCRQDVDNIRAACRKRIGWRVIDAGGRTINTGSGITLRAVGDINS